MGCRGCNLGALTSWGPQEEICLATYAQSDVTGSLTVCLVQRPAVVTPPLIPLNLEVLVTVTLLELALLSMTVS